MHMMTEQDVIDQELTEQQMLDFISDMFMNQMPFNDLLGMRITRYTTDSIELRINMDDKLIGNPIRKILHGGVTASLLDVAGGMLVAAAAIPQMTTKSAANFHKNLKSLGTIDLRVDYLRPGWGDEFTATAQIIRSGNKVAVTRMELHNQEGVHIAFGTGTYLVG
jgi:uncharacterized protein (TIGR00369 family)